MENAVAELSQEHNGGVLVWYLELLWAQSSVKKLTADDDDANPPPSYLADFPTIPQTVVFNYSHAQGWFFEPSSLKPSTLRRIRRKRRQHLVAKDIFEELATPYDALAAHGHPKRKSKSALDGDEDATGAANNGGAGAQQGGRRSVKSTAADRHKLVAQLITKGHSPNVVHPRITYLTQEGLDTLLFHGTISEGSLLQKFVMPQGPRTEPYANPNVCFSVIWQPTYCFVERYVNQNALGDASKLPEERGATFEDTKVSAANALGNNATTLHRCLKACNAMAEHVARISGRHLRAIYCVMKIDTQNRLNLLFVQRVTISDAMRPGSSRLDAIRSLVTKTANDADNSDASSSDEDDGGKGAGMHNQASAASLRHSIAARERLTELSRCNSAVRRSKLQALVPEEDADSAFDCIAPRSWALQGRQAYRFAAIPSRMPTHRRSHSASLAQDISGSFGEVIPEGTLSSSQAASASMRRNPAGVTPTAAGSRSAGSPKATMGLRRGSTLRDMNNTFATAMRQVEQEITVKSEATIVVSATKWNEPEHPSRVEVALMKDATTDLYPLKRVAHNAASLGLREKYLASMRAASSSRISGW